MLAELNRVNEDLHNRYLFQAIDYLILRERMHLAVNSFRNLRDVVAVEKIELLLQSFQLYAIIIERIDVGRVVVDVEDPNYVSQEMLCCTFRSLVTHGKICRKCLMFHGGLYIK